MKKPDEQRLFPSRRQMLKSHALGFGYLALASLLADEARGESSPSVLSRAPHFIPRAKRVVFLFMKGGPSHMDTFDYKPRLQRDHGKDLPFAKPRVQFAKTEKLLKSPWAFHPAGASGVPISELFPHVARHADDICFLNSVHGTNSAHGGACLKLHTGSDNFVRPSLGSWITYGLGTENRDLPAFITICPTLAHGGVNNWSSSFLPAHYQGTPLGVASQPASAAKLRYASNPVFSKGLQRRQLDLLEDMNREHLGVLGSSPLLEGRITSYELAFRMQQAVPEAQDLSGETALTRKLYGLDEKITSDFGRQCLLARRFLERGVRFVQVTHSDGKVQWDQHSDLLKGHQKNAKEVDLPIAGLLADLKSRGLLDDTLVFWTTEFGRMPFGQNNSGRDHNGGTFVTWLGGAGIKSGQTYGESDPWGWRAASNPTSVHDLHATILHLLGINHKRLTYLHNGIYRRLTDVHGHVIKEILT